MVIKYKNATQVKRIYLVCISIFLIIIAGCSDDDKKKAKTDSNSTYIPPVLEIPSEIINSPGTGENTTPTDSGNTTTPGTDVVAPSVVNISSPTSNPYTSGESSINLNGSCEIGATVNLIGATTSSTTCNSLGQFQFTITQSSDATYNYLLSQTDAANNISTSLFFRWIRNTSVPLPTLTSPATSPITNNSNQLTIIGNCTSNFTVYLNGASTQSMACNSAGTYSFNVNPNLDGEYSFGISQRDSWGNTSASLQLTWVRDTTSPLAIVITSPTANPYTSGDSTKVISGNCEHGSQIQISGAQNLSTSCSMGSFSIQLAQSSDGAYDYAFNQVDASGNISPTRSFQWVRDATIPATPTISNPAVSPFYSNLSSLSISGACTVGNTVWLDNGSTPSSTTCSGAGTYTFTVNNSVDATYPLSLYQENPTTLATSGTVELSWVRDTSIPAIPQIVNPSSNPFTGSGDLNISGVCELNSTVDLNGDFTDTRFCSTGSYNFLISKSVDATYNFTITQVDRANNTSTAATLQWIRSTGVDPIPVIISPSLNPYSSNNSGLALNGTCSAGLTVTLAGSIIPEEITSPAGSLSQVCTNGQFTFNISKSLDGTYDLSLTQGNSGSVNFQWTRDTTAPETNLLTYPTNPNLSVASNFTFSSPDALASFECSLDGSAYIGCVSPFSLTGLANQNHTLNIRAKDSVGNLDPTPSSYSWDQASGNTVALYHFSSGTDLTDSGRYSNANSLTNNSSTTTSLGKFNDGRVLAAASSQSLSAVHSPSLNLLNSVMTIDTWVKFTSLPTSRAAIVSKMGNSGQMGWEFGLKKQGAKYQLYFLASANGTTVTEFKSANLTTAEVNALTLNHTHFAATFNAGSVKIFMGGTSKATGSLTGSTTLFSNSNTALVIGATATGTNYLDGIIDELRLSQVLRWSANFDATQLSEYSNPD